MTSTSRTLAGRVAVVTGAGRNIGRAIALGLGGVGAAVVVNARANRAEAETVAAEIEKAGGRAFASLADVTDADALARMAAETRKRFGRVDVLVNNAAVRRDCDIDRMALEEWRSVLGVILDGAFLAVKAFLPDLRASGEGAIVNIGGLNAHTGAAGRPHVVAAKMGLVGLTRALAHDLAADGITVNCVVPGLIEMVRDPSSSVDPRHDRTLKTLFGTKGSPDDVAQAVCYLAGPGARYVTGQCLHVNGGVFLP